MRGVNGIGWKIHKKGGTSPPELQTKNEKPETTSKYWKPQRVDLDCLKPKPPASK